MEVLVRKCLCVDERWDYDLRVSEFSSMGVCGPVL